MTTRDAVAESETLRLRVRDAVRVRVFAKLGLREAVWEGVPVWLHVRGALAVRVAEAEAVRLAVAEGRRLGLGEAERVALGVPLLSVPVRVPLRLTVRTGVSESDDVPDGADGDRLRVPEREGEVGDVEAVGLPLGLKEGGTVALGVQLRAALREVVGVAVVGLALQAVSDPELDPVGVAERLDVWATLGLLDAEGLALAEGEALRLRLRLPVTEQVAVGGGVGVAVRVGDGLVDPVGVGLRDGRAVRVLADPDGEGVGEREGVAEGDRRLREALEEGDSVGDDGVAEAERLPLGSDGLRVRLALTLPVSDRDAREREADGLGVDRVTLRECVRLDCVGVRLGLRARDAVRLRLLVPEPEAEEPPDAVSVGLGDVGLRDSDRDREGLRLRDAVKVDDLDPDPLCVGVRVAEGKAEALPVQVRLGVMLPVAGREALRLRVTEGETVPECVVVVESEGDALLMDAEEESLMLEDPVAVVVPRAVGVAVRDHVGDADTLAVGVREVRVTEHVLDRDALGLPVPVVLGVRVPEGDSLPVVVLERERLRDPLAVAMGDGLPLPDADLVTEDREALRLRVSLRLPEGERVPVVEPVAVAVTVTEGALRDVVWVGARVWESEAVRDSVREGDAEPVGDEALRDGVRVAEESDGDLEGDGEPVVADRVARVWVPLTVRDADAESELVPLRDGAVGDGRRVWVWVCVGVALAEGDVRVDVADCGLALGVPEMEEVRVQDKLRDVGLRLGDGEVVRLAVQEPVEVAPGVAARVQDHVKEREGEGVAVRTALAVDVQELVDQWDAVAGTLGLPVPVDVLE